MPGAALGLGSPVAPESGAVGAAALTWYQAPVLPLGCRAQPGATGQEHAPAALLMPSSSSCALLLSVEQETLQLRPSPGSCLCPQPGSAGSGLSQSPECPARPQAEPAVIFWASPRAALGHTASAGAACGTRGRSFPERLWEEQ